MSEAATKTEPQRPGPAISRSIVDIVADLEKPVADRHVSSRRQGQTNIKYIAWYNAERYLDFYAAGWKKEIKEVMNIAGNVAMTIRITIPCIEGDVYREATGYESDDKSGFGDPFSNAESMALRRAAATFGLGRYLYDK
jgi:hypothetical protein